MRTNVSVVVAVIVSFPLQALAAFTSIVQSSFQPDHHVLYAAARQSISIALTREIGKNEKLRQELETRIDELTTMIQWQELPCIAHAPGEDLERLAPILHDQVWNYVAVTSPEAAQVLATKWKVNDSTSASAGADPSVVAVGQATKSTLEALGIPVAFCPSKATAETLVKELSLQSLTTSSGTTTTTTTVLYPASAKAANTIQDGLSARGFVVTRLNTYDTVTATWSEDEQALAATTNIVCFGSPSSVEGWLINSHQNRNILAACIGETSAEACRKNSFSEDQIFCPDKPGISGWASAVLEAMKHHHERVAGIPMV